MAFAFLVDSQRIFRVDSFTLESGVELNDVPVAYKTWGTLNESKDNVMVICHAFTGSADVEDWWGPLMGIGKAFDSTRWFIFCANVLGSPYGTASPVTINPQTGTHYGPDFPATTIRDDVRLHKLVLDHLGVRSVAVVVGGSMGGMATLEWPLCSPPGYVRHIIALATSARHSAWCISWGEAQRQSIFSDPDYSDGWYTKERFPKNGLGAARMAALLTYRSRDSFESRFGRKHQQVTITASSPTRSPHHNDGLRSPSAANGALTPIDAEHRPKIFTAQSYLRYQGEKFNSRFDANCYVHITRKLDTHDVTRGRATTTDDEAALAEVLGQIPPGALVVSIQTDGLFTPSEQRELAKHIPGAELVVINSPDGHDGFLLEFEQINRHILEFVKKNFPEQFANGITEEHADPAVFATIKTSMFGEAEGADLAMW